MAPPVPVETYKGWQSLPAMFFERVAEFGDRPFLWRKAGGKWSSQSWAEAGQAINHLARGLMDLGIGDGDRVVLASENRPEWPIAELAIMAAGAIPVPAYTTNTADDHAHIIDNTQAKAAIVSDNKLLANLLPAAHNSATCKHVIVMEKPDLKQEVGEIKVHAWDDVTATGSQAPDTVQANVDKLRRNDTAVIIHTSGTGGAPRGVMLSHGAILSNCMGAVVACDHQLSYGDEIFLSFLPLSHAYEHMAGHFMPISIAAQIYYAGSIDTLVSDMADVKPTIMTAVPRLYEVMHTRVSRAMKDMSGTKRKMFDAAYNLGKRKYEKGGLPPHKAVMDGLLDKLVRKKVRGRFGGRLKFFVSGGAPLNHDIGMFFTALGVKLLQGYGQTEAAPLISVNPPDNAKIHTVGPPVHDVEVRIAEDGEICVRGELVMQGYYGDPEATRQVILDGWLHTGDIGELDEDGHIVITDRKKDIIVNSGGDNVSPQRVEGFLTLQPEIGQAMVIGDKRPHLVAALVPDPDFMRDWAKEHGKANDLASLSQDAEFIAVLNAAVDRVNKDLSNVERVRRFLVAREDFTIENGMLTPSMKIRRHMINKIYGEDLDALYGAKKTPAAEQAAE